MITPRFNLSQNQESLTITIRAPYCSLRELDVNVEDNVFIFFCRPYYLRLNLPGNVLENDRSKSKFDADVGEFTFTYDKETVGEHFADLDFITKLLSTKIDVVEEGGRTIELLTTTEETNVPADTNDVEYGFAMRGGYKINDLQSEFAEVFKINPHQVKLCERASLRIKNENEKFDSDHYFADFIDNEEITNITLFSCPWISIDDVVFTPKELDFLKDLPNVQYNLNPSQIRYCHNSLLEILYAYCYDRRTTFFEGTCESGWTISTLSASFSWFDGFDDVKSAMTCAYRRSLIFPLHRSFVLSEQVFEDMKALLRLGEKFLIKSLIEIYYVFLGGDSGQFILNNLFLKDYVVYVMKWNKELWSDVVDEVMTLKIEKADLGLHLLDIEESVNCCVDITDGLLDLKLKDDSTDSDDSSEADSSEYESCDSNA